MIFDKHNFYKRKIPEDVYSKINVNIQALPQLEEIIKISQIDKMSSNEIIDFANIASVSKSLNRAEKDMVVNALDKAIENPTSQEDTTLLKRMQEARNTILKRKQQIQNLAKENISTTNEEFEDVSNLSGEEKHKARAANKKKNKDKLSEKEKIAKLGKNLLTAVRAKKLEDLKNQR